MAQYDFDRVPERRWTDSRKWEKYGDAVIPLWVADMDFPSPEPVLKALHERVGHGVFGYAYPRKELFQAIQERFHRLYRWEVEPEEIFFVPTLLSGLNLIFQIFSRPGDGILIQPPVYHRFIKDALMHDRVIVDPPLVPKGDTYEIDFEAFERAITKRTKIFLLCNPHNPVGRVFTAEELTRLAEICLRHRLVICSDEIHCELLYPGHRHIALATLGPEVARQTITLNGPGKTFNLPGLHLGFAVISNAQWREIWKKASYGLIPSVNSLAQAAAIAAYREGQEWLDQLLVYLEGNRDFLARTLKDRIPGIQMTRMEATYLAWLDCRGAGIPGDPFEFFLKKAQVAMMNGPEFGRGGEGFLRLNFACSRSTLAQALDRMAMAITENNIG
jgi:cystathionine beta-lyase